jgi:hypothetical protein
VKFFLNSSSIGAYIDVLKLSGKMLEIKDLMSKLFNIVFLKTYVAYPKAKVIMLYERF